MSGSHLVKTPSPQVKLAVGSRVLIGRPEDPGTRLMTFRRRCGPRHDSRLEFESDDGVHFMPLSDEQIGYLCQQGEFNIVVSVGGRDLPLPPSPIKLNDKQTAYANRCKGYVDACLALGRSFRRSHPVLRPVIEEHAQHREDGKIPGVTTVLHWIDIWEASGEQYGLAVFVMLRKTGNGHKDLGDAINTAITYGVQIALREGTAEDALYHARNWLKTNRPGEDFEDSRFPSIRSIQRRMETTNKLVADEIKFGPQKARRRNGIKYETKRPLLPLEEVEVDNTPLDIILLDESQSIVLGRPNLISFRDRATGSVIGLSLGWEAPSYAAFMHGFRHAIYPKRPGDTPAVRSSWYCWGRMRRLYVDNALEFLGDNIQNASSQLLFQLAEFRPGNPWLKGAQERLFKTLNMKVHKLPGATFSNIMQRRDREEIAKLPILTRSELWNFLTVFLCDVYHREPHEGLGTLRTQKDIPARLWTEAVQRVSIAPPPSEDDFIALAGDSDFKSVTGKGIQWDYIRYGCAELASIRTHPKHRDGRTDGDRPGRKHEGTSYQVRRDPFDLSHIWVINHHDRNARPIKVPAMRMDYADGLTLHQHRVVKNNADKKLLKTPRVGEDAEDELIRAKERLAAAIADVLQIRKAQNVARMLARFMNEEGRKQATSTVTDSPLSPQQSRHPLDPTRKHATAGMAKVPLLSEPGSPSKDNATATARGSESRLARRTQDDRPPPPSDDDDFDVEAMQREKAANKKWGTV